MWLEQTVKIPTTSGHRTDGTRHRRRSAVHGGNVDRRRNRRWRSVQASVTKGEVHVSSAHARARPYVRHLPALLTAQPDATPAEQKANARRRHRTGARRRRQNPSPGAGEGGRMSEEEGVRGGCPARVWCGGAALPRLVHASRARWTEVGSGRNKCGGGEATGSDDGGSTERLEVRGPGNRRGMSTLAPLQREGFQGMGPHIASAGELTANSGDAQALREVRRR
ncbi:hypothetical protein B0H17DRAFT_1079036 [Mycena rosella]|uniref:Uncharacterized protein n=1 Tax=Mycena rosella TaxID=1033263 RepID=A0AAD7GCW5_MYCRO|nr:hypothetical protein B0H17DRAFT_1079036 [Mycena rosella]